MTNSQQYKPIYALSFWKAYFIQMRPYLLFISGVVGAVGLIYGVDGNSDLTQIIFIFLALFLGYGFGQALTDCFQLDTDRLSAPYRPLSRGIIRVKETLIVSLGGLCLISFTLIYFNRWNILFCVLSIIGLATYTFFKKRYWMIGPFYNAWIVALLPIMGYLAMKEGNLSSLNNSKLFLILGTSFFSYATFVLMGYLKDIKADSLSNYKTLPVVFGWNAAVWVSDIFILISIVLCWILVQYSFLGMVILVIASIIAVYGQYYAHVTKEKTESNAAIPIASTVRSLILWHIALILSIAPEYSWVAIIFYLLFEYALKSRPEKSQI